MAELVPAVQPIGQIPLTTTEAPHPYGNVAGAIEGAANLQARGLKEAGAGLMDLATPIAEAQAASDLQNQKVTIGPDGKMQVINPARSFAFGRAGEAAGAAIKAGTVSQAGAAVDTALTDIHMKHLGDPQGQAAANDAFVQGLKGFSGNPMIDAAVSNRARETAAQHYDHNLEFTTRIGVANTERSLNATIESAKESLAELARNGVSEDNPEWVKQKGILDAAQNEQQSNPLLKRTPEEIALDQSQTKTRWAGERLIGSLPKAIDAEGLVSAKGKVDEMLANPGLEPKTRQYLRVEANRILAEAQPKWQEDNRNYDLAIAGAERDIAAGKVGPDDPTVKQLRQYGSDHGMERAPAFEAFIYQHHLTSNLGAATPSQRNNAMGIPHTPTPGVAPPDATVQPAGAVTPEAMSNAILGQESGGNPNERTSVDNAHGIGQIIPATFNQYARPGERIDNANDNLAVHHRIINDYMQRYNGDPARVAVAYFSGPDNVSEPGSALPYKTNSHDGNGVHVSDYVNQVMGRLGKGGSIASQRAAAGQPQFTPEEVKKYGPALFAAAFAKENQDPAEKLSFFNAKIGMMESGLKVGVLPSQEDMTDIYRTGNDNKDDPRYQEKIASLEGLFRATAAQGMAPGQQQALMGSAMAAAQQPGADMQTKAMVSAYNRQTEEWDKQWKSAPISMASKFMGTQVNPLDMTSAQSFQQGLAARANAASAILSRRGEAVSALDPEDVSQVKAALANPDPAVKASIYGALANLPAPTRDATLAKLGGGEPQGMAEAAAGSLMGTNPALAQSIFRGMAAMKADKRFDPEDEGAGSKGAFLSDKDKALPPTIFPLQGRTDPSGPYATLSTMIKARYADLKAQAGSFTYDTTTLNQAVNDVTGGVLSHNGSPFIAPSPGMNQSTFDRVLNGVTDDQMNGARTLGGQAVSADYLRQNGQLESAGDGQYFVKLGRDPMKPIYAYNADGKSKFVLDLRNAKPGAAPPLTMAPPSNIPGMGF